MAAAMTEPGDLPEPWRSEARFYQAIAAAALGHAVALRAASQGLALQTLDDHRERLEREATLELQHIGAELMPGTRGPVSYVERMAVCYFFAHASVGNVVRDYSQAAERPAGASIN
jgi:hypothetical protein